jgi:hypothetical protein
MTRQLPPIANAFGEKSCIRYPLTGGAMIPRSTTQLSATCSAASKIVARINGIESCAGIMQHSLANKG